MRRGLLGGAFFSFALLWQIDAQQVEVPRQALTASVSAAVEDEEEIIPRETGKPQATSNKPEKPKITVEDMRKAGALAREKIEKETRLTTKYLVPSKSPTQPGPVSVRASFDRQSTFVPAPASRPSSTFVAAPPTRSSSTFVAAPSSTKRKDATISESAPSRPISFEVESAFTKLADGFDFPVGRPDAQGYYKARGFRSNGHLGEDWDGVRGGDTDLGDPIYAIGDGVVVFARDCHMGWGNVVIIRHAFREYGEVKNIDSLYGHLQTILVRRGQAVTRGQKIATMGNAHGIYDAHLHFEIRKNLAIGMSRAKFARDASNYYDPSQFVLSHRHLQTGSGNYRVAMNTFTYDSLIHWDRERNYSRAHTGGGSSESAAALKKTVASQR
jgi:murein DD-endopeptidase MepM/ murein hydrolase activator NlpD